MSAAPDIWSRWLLETRSGGDAALAALHQASLAKLRDRVLRYADLREGETLLDVGCGDGLIAFGALERIGAAGRVIFSDISRPLLDHCRQLARDAGVEDRCRFVEAPADDLRGIDADSVDVVTTRSVLIYVNDKAAAFREFRRVLRPGGRVSIFEPINAFRTMMGPADTFDAADLGPAAPIARRLNAHYETFCPANSAMLDFDERDLLRLAEDAGFRSLRLLYEAEIGSGGHSPAAAIPSWDAYINAPPNPLMPSLAGAMRAVLSDEEAVTFEHYARPLFESGRTRHSGARAYLQASKERS